MIDIMYETYNHIYLIQSLWKQLQPIAFGDRYVEVQKRFCMLCLYVCFTLCTVYVSSFMQLINITFVQCVLDVCICMDNVI